MAPIVRRIRLDEAEGLRMVRLRALGDAPDAFASTFPDEARHPPELWAARARDGATGDRVATFVAGEDEVPVGLVTGLRDGADVVELVSLWVDPAHRRDGLGADLVGAVVAWAADVGAERVELWCTIGNGAAEALYRAAGFVPTDDVQPLPSDPCREELRMVRHLDGPVAGAT